MSKSFEIKKSLKIIPGTEASDTAGELRVDSADSNALKYYNGSVESTILTEDAPGDAITELTGDVTATGPGSVAATIANGAVTNAKMASGIDAVKLGDGSVSNTEFQSLNGVTSAIQTQLDAKQPLDSDLTALAALSSTGLVARTGSGTAAVRTLTGTANQITVTNGDGVSGNPTAAIASDAVFPGTGANTLVTGTTGQRPSGTAGQIRYNSTLGQFEGYTTGWGAIGGSGTGLKNYITSNQNIEQGATTGFSLGTTGTLTNGLPTGTPTFGSGASGNLSISASSSSPLAGTYSLLYASSAATTQGNMLATDAITLDAEAQGNVLAFRFAYNASSGASNMNLSGTPSNSYGVALYDVTNSAWIPVAGQFNLIQSSGTGFASGTAQIPISTTSVRLVIYNVNATAGAATLKLDDFFLGPQVTVQGYAGTDWVPYTPTFTGFGTVTSIEFYSRRVGDSLQISGKFIAGTPTATEARISLGFNGGNSNVTVDSSKLPSGNQIVGIATTVSASTTLFGFASLASGGQSYITVGNQTSTQALLTVAINGNSFSPVGAVNAFTAVVPIAGWSSNTVMSNDTDTRVVAAVYTNTAGTSIGTSLAVLPFPTIGIDTHSAYNTSTGVFTAPVSGIYRVSSVVFSAASTPSTTQFFQTAVYKNGSLYQYFSTPYGNGSSTTLNSVGSVDVSLNAGETVAIYATAALATSANTTAGANRLSIERLSGPATIAATESVNASYNTSTSTFANSASTTLVCTNKLYDSHAAFNTSTGVYTVPVSGKYRVTSSWAATGTSNANTAIQAFINRNGSSVSSSYQWGSAATNGVLSAQIADTITCSAGDTLNVQYNQNGGSTVTASTTAALVRISVERVGN